MPAYRSNQIGHLRGARGPRGGRLNRGQNREGGQAGGNRRQGANPYALPV